MIRHYMLTGSLLLGSMVLMAQTTPSIYPDMPFNRLSPNGEYAVSETSAIINLKTGEQYSYRDQYGVGSGNAVSNTGVVVGYKISYELAYYWQNGAWTQLPVTEGTSSSYANGVSPDGKYIVGEVAPDTYSGNYEGNMLIPCYWELQDDGKYSLPKNLPHPTRDFTGRPPQYITAVRISSDGKTIAGQMKDFSGFICQPVIYTQGANGEWQYSLLLDEMFHPAGVELPEDPGEGPIQQDFMTPEEITAYNQAVYLWEALGGDISTYPDIWNYMTQEELEAYNEAAMTWNEISEEYYSALSKLYSMVPNFSYNNVITDSDIHFYVSTDNKSFFDEYTGVTEQNNVIYVVDLIDGGYKTYPGVDDVNLTATSMADDGTVLAQYHDYDYGIFNGYILPPGKDQFESLYGYIAQNDPTLGGWMKENMTHNYTAINIDDWTEYTATTLATGVPYTTPDMKLICMAIANFWDYDSPYDTFGYLISPKGMTKVESLEEGSTLDIQTLPGGMIAIKGNVESLEIYALSGQKVLSVSNPCQQISTSLPKGIYVVKACENGQNPVTKKIIIK